VVKLQADGYADSTCNRFTQLLLQAFKLADLPVPKIKKLRELNAREGFFERADFLRVLANLPEHLKDFCAFGYYTGWRKSALSNLEWTDVDDDKVYLRAIHSKTRKPVTVPLVGPIAAIISRRRVARVLHSPAGEISLCRFVFHRDGKPIQDFRKSWRTACRAAGVTKLFHDFRRTACRDLVNAGVSETVAMTITGHKTRAVFDRYNIGTEAQKISAFEDRSTYHAKQDERSAPVTRLQ
jgi:integrase